jgi:hypothetical protein
MVICVSIVLSAVRSSFAAAMSAWNSSACFWAALLGPVDPSTHQASDTPEKGESIPAEPVWRSTVWRGVLLCSTRLLH